MCSAASFLLLCRARDVGGVYTFNATLLFLLVSADLVFVLATGRLRLAASHKHGVFRACDLSTGRLLGACLAGLVLTLLVVGASVPSIGHPIRAGLGWYAFHAGDVAAVVTDLWVLVAIVVVSISTGRALKRRQWRRAVSSLLGLLALSLLAATIIGAWTLAAQHALWAFGWFLGGLVVAAALGKVAIDQSDAADRAEREKGQGRRPPTGADPRTRARTR